jgi:hypothetical protein
MLKIDKKCEWSSYRVVLYESKPGSSGSTVSGYGLADRLIEVRSPAEAKDFCCSLCVQTGSGAHPASSTMSTGDPFPGGRARQGRDADHSPRPISSLTFSCMQSLSNNQPLLKTFIGHKPDSFRPISVIKTNTSVYGSNLQY